MTRTILAFIVAPLWVPLVILFITSFFRPLDTEYSNAAIATVFVSLVFSSGCTVLFGVPAFRFLRSRNLTAPWIAVIVGFTVGAAVVLIAAILFALSLGNNVLHSLATVQSMFANGKPRDLLWLGGAGSLGALVGITLWMIARPDRN